MDWRRCHTIGRGSSAIVSIATSTSSGEVFAVKSVEVRKSKFLQREQRILSTLCSPHVVGYKGYDITREDSKFVYNLLMEYVPCGTLSDVICKQGGRLDELSIRHYTRHLVQGLEYIHSSNIVHCDIKGRNILICEGCPKIADFGCAKWANQAATFGSQEKLEDATVPIGGTPIFMAPEVARGEEQEFPADIWALGCTIIEMATGGSPWPSVTNSALSTIYKIAFSAELPEFPDFLSNKGKDFLGSCLKRDPKERWTAKQLLQHPYLEQVNSREEKVIQYFNTSSPTSILDQGIWNSMEESDCLAAVNSSSAQRIKQLSYNSRSVPNWRCDVSWITVRCNEEKEEDCVVCGSLTALTNDDLEAEEEGSDGFEDYINLLNNNVSSCSNSSDNILVACECNQDSGAAISSMNFQRKGRNC